MCFQLLCRTMLNRTSLCVTFSRLQTAAEAGYAQVVVATDKRRRSATLSDIRMGSIVMERRSPMLSDIRMGSIAIELLRQSFVSLTSRCDQKGFGLVGDMCVPCPMGAFCPGTHFAASGRQTYVCHGPAWTAGGGRMWPDKGHWNRGERSGFVRRCYPSLRCLGGPFSQCALGYEADYCAKCSTGYARCKPTWFP